MMKPSAPESSELTHQLRQQLILAQVRIMELEDIRDEITPKLVESDSLLGKAQTLAEAKVDEAEHLAKIRAALQKEYEHLQHIQHVTNTALKEARDGLMTQTQKSESYLREIESLQTLSKQLATQEQAHRNQIVEQKQQLSELRTESAAHIARIEQLDQERRATQASRSWRWTAWLRAIERRFK